MTSPDRSHNLGGSCIERFAEPKICGVPRYLCTDCRGEHYFLPCDSFRAIIGPETHDCQVCVHRESDLDACVYGSRARACMTTPCGFERVNWE